MKMSRRGFLKILGSAGKKVVNEIPKGVAKIPKKTVGNVSAHDDIVRSIKKQGMDKMTRRTVLRKIEERTGKLMMSNPKEVNHGLRKGVSGISSSIKNVGDPMRVASQQAIADGTFNPRSITGRIKGIMEHLGFSSGNRYWTPTLPIPHKSVITYIRK